MGNKPVEDSAQIEAQTAVMKQKINKLTSKLRKKNQDIQVVLIDTCAIDKNMKKLRELTAQASVVQKKLRKELNIRYDAANLKQHEAGLR